MINPVTLSATASGTAAASGTTSMAGMLITFVPIILLFVLMWLIMIRPQNKKRKEEDNMRKNAQIGDDITTIGGICGRIVGIKEDNDTLVIETGTDRAKMRIKRWAVGSVDTIHDNPIEEGPKKKRFFGKKKDDADTNGKSKKGKEEDVL
ncbi:preprotein translocase subunit YajC [Caproicibacterium amylolyticum]|jgi:preprotein translocase subunit YajC|uniref:Preprotein translocase subunit YajC n=1 Tax=Caproicibacterium amylolyticum TaxID=2766537 RepID=A0A7G9WKS1_9FIRM|nr:preprotein translocase subunit YajC [Caproicibacterium amylolyticum]QNO19283.1 preprotein translocase subunit YajC [Caproicibacterium amylolyticum]